MSLDVLKTEVKKITTGVEKVQIVSSIKDVLKNLKSK
jgi:hypothetical protein